MLTQQPTKQHSTNQTTKQQKNLLFRSFIRNSELRSKFLDKPSKTSFVVLSLEKSKLKRALFAFPLVYS